MINDGWGYHSAVVRAGDYLFLSNVLGTLPDGNLAQGWDDLPSDGRALKTNRRALDAREGLVGAQAWAGLKRLDALLREHGSSIDGICQMQVYLTNKKLFPFYGRVRMRLCDSFPPNCCLGVEQVDPSGQAAIAFDVVAAVHTASAADPRAAPGTQPIGDPASAMGVRTQDHVWLSGTIPLDAESQVATLDWPDVAGAGPPDLRSGYFDIDYWDGPIIAQTLEVQRQIGRRLAAMGLGFDDVVRVVTYLRSYRDFPAFERVHRGCFPRPEQPLTVIQVNDVSSITDIKLEIEVVAALPTASPKKVVLPGTPDVQAASRDAFAVRSGPLLFVGSRVGLDASGRSIVERLADVSGAPRSLRRWGRTAPALERAASQTAAILDAMGASLEVAGSGLREVRKLHVYLTDFRDYLAVSETIGAYFPEHPPAISVVQVPVAGPGRGTTVAIDALGAVSERGRA